jgi:hypothetical protein
VLRVASQRIPSVGILVSRLQSRSAARRKSPHTRCPSPVRAGTRSVPSWRMKIRLRHRSAARKRGCLEPQRATRTYENSVQYMGGVIPLTGPQASSSLRLCPSRANEIRLCTLPQGSTVRTQIPMAQGGKRLSVVECGFFRQPVVRSGDTVQPEAQPRRTSFPAAESLVALVSPSRMRDVFSIGDNNRNTN